MKLWFELFRVGWISCQMGTSTKLLMVALQANGNEIKTHFFPFCA
jgi:hypothetical protein